MDKKYAWVAFALAACCCIGALVYVFIDNARNKPKVRSAAPSAPVDVPRFVPVQRADTTATVPPSTTTPTLPPATGPTAGQLVQVYPGGWVWNPGWHTRFYWDGRVDPTRWDRVQWSWWNTWWDREGRRPWMRGPLPPEKHRHWGH